MVSYRLRETKMLFIIYKLSDTLEKFSFNVTESIREITKKLTEGRTITDHKATIGRVTFPYKV